MTSYDPDPEPSSIAPMLLDTNQWKIDLDNLHTGVRFDFSVPPQVDDEDVAIAPKKSRTGRRILGAMTAMLLVAGLGFAAFRGRPLLQRVTAGASGAPARVAQTTMTAAPPAVAPAPPPPPVVAAPPPPAPPAPVAAAPAPEPKAAKGQKPIPTFSANALPNAPKKRGGKRAK